MSATIRLFAGVLWAAALTACGGGGGGSSGPVWKQTAYITRPQNCSSASPHFARLIIMGAEKTDYCAYAPNPLSMPNGGCPPNDDGEKVMQLAYVQANMTGGDVQPIGPGTYTDRDMWITGMMGNGSYTCPNTEGTGSMTLTTVSETVVEGTYDITINGEHYSGTIKAPVCWYGDEVCGT